MRQWSQARRAQWKYEGLLGCALASILLFLISTRWQLGFGPTQRTSLRVTTQSQGRGEVLVSYSYFEKDEGQMQNFDYFILSAMGIHDERNRMPVATDFSIVVNGDYCSPCATLSPHVSALDISLAGVSAVWSGLHITVLHRIDNFGMDIAAHNVTLSHLQRTNKEGAYKYFIFLNSSVRGPFFPSYFPATWQWPDAFVSRLSRDVKLVSSSIVCLPAIDPGGYGPKAESWAFALDAQSLALLVDKGIFWTRTCKVCHGDEGIVVASEYGMSKAILEAGFNLGTLMARYAPDTDWRDMANWNCNNNVHPSRHGTYDGISMHPYETMFVKESWHVGEPFLSRYTRWRKEHSAGRPGTEGSFDEDLYFYAMCNEGRRPQRTRELFLPNNLTCTGSDQ